LTLESIINGEIRVAWGVQSCSCTKLPHKVFVLLPNSKVD
jgi:hypothetical protein